MTPTTIILLLLLSLGAAGQSKDTLWLRHSDSTIQPIKADTFRYGKAILVIDSSGKQYWRLPSGNEYGFFSCDSSDFAAVKWIHVDTIKPNTTIYDNGWPIGYIGNTDTLPNGPVVFTVQPCRNCALTWVDGYLIGGEPYVKERGKMVRRKWYKWEVKK